MFLALLAKLDVSVNVLSLLMAAVLSEDIASDGPVSSRGKSTDCMTFWSTVPGFASFRHEIEGEFTSIVLIFVSATDKITIFSLLSRRFCLCAYLYLPLPACLRRAFLCLACLPLPSPPFACLCLHAFAYLPVFASLPLNDSLPAFVCLLLPCLSLPTCLPATCPCLSLTTYLLTCLCLYLLACLCLCVCFCMSLPAHLPLPAYLPAFACLPLPVFFYLPLPA